VETIGTLDWTGAKCATGDARLLHLFFSEDQAEIGEARAICQSCPLRLPCLEGAIERGEPWGVWGGQLFDRGRVIDRKRGRGRPRKEDARPQVVEVA
jgi:WhiB family redox-sensing transcriptional regulator